MVRQAASIKSLRLWLHSASLLAVVAGYSLLMLTNQQWSELRRLRAHETMLAQLKARLQDTAQTPKSMTQQDILLAPGIRLTKLSAEDSVRASSGHLFKTRAKGEWLITPVAISLSDGTSAVLEVRENVSIGQQQEWFGFWLLAISAGVSCLFTSLLLRLVLQRGLTQPISRLSSELGQTQSPSQLRHPITEDDQPDELRPIATAFNELQDRLNTSWERERTFVSGMTHELRTPITLISGRVQRLLRRDDITPIREELETMHREARQISSLVSDLMTMARHDAGHLSIENKAISIVEQAISAYEKLESRASGRLILEISEEYDHLQGVADPERLQQCLTVLVDNALQYSPAKEMVKLSCSMGPSSWPVLHVLDRGPGVGPEEHQLIFERFKRGTAGVASGHRGSGVGLSLVKELIDAMGGRVEVHSAPGGGADFQLHIRPLPPLTHRT